MTAIQQAIATAEKAHALLARTDEINALANGSTEVRHRTLTREMQDLLVLLRAIEDKAAGYPSLDALASALDELDYLTDEA